jgi:feruloyl esterase
MLPFLFLGGLTGLAQATNKISRDSKCTSLAQSLQLPNTTVWFSESVSANTTVSLPDNHPTCNSPSFTASVDMCRVAMLVSTSNSPSSNISVETWLPADWNGRFLSTANGGLAGCIQYEDMVYGVSQGFATASGNGGHNGTSGIGFYMNPGAVENFSYRSVHLGAVLGKQVSESYYGKPHSKSYYLGCSTGGRQGFKEAQEFPGDFDGIVAGAPAMNFAALISWSGHFYVLTGPPGSPTFLSPQDWALVKKDVLAQCDGLDGLVDGIIEDPNLCQYRPEALICGAAGNNTGSCLTAEQTATVRSAFAEYHGINGTLIYPRFQPSGDPSLMMNGKPFAYAEDWFRYVVYNDTTWDPATLTPQDYAAAQALNPFNIDTWKGDLSGARDAGLKILHYHGLQDSLISSDNSERYYNRVSRTMDLTNDELDSFYRYFRIAGMDHCSWGVDGAAWKIGNLGGSFVSAEPERNVLWAMVKWVEDGVAPEYILGSGSHAATNKTVERRHCRYPRRGKYKGEGDGDDANSWECV